MYGRLHHPGNLAQTAEAAETSLSVVVEPSACLFVTKLSISHLSAVQNAKHHTSWGSECSAAIIGGTDCCTTAAAAVFSAFVSGLAPRAIISTE